MESKNKGGRPRIYANGASRVTISLPNDLIPEFKKRGSNWVRIKLQEELNYVVQRSIETCFSAPAKNKKVSKPKKL